MKRITIESSPINTKKAKFPLSWSPLPNEFWPFLGRIGLEWGAFEIKFDNFLLSMLKTNPEPPENIRTNFKKRIKLFRSELKRCFRDCPITVAYLNEIINDASEVQWKRNLLLHGKISFVVKHTQDGFGNSKQQHLVSASRHHKGQEKISEFNLDAIEQLAYDIAHASGRLGLIESGIPIIPNMTDFEKSFLQAFIKNNYAPPFIPS